MDDLARRSAREVLDDHLNIANDWTDLPQLMHYSVHLFRAYAVEPSIFQRPFTDAQVARFRAGVVPDGDL